MPVEYYIVINDRQQGPFSKEDLRNNNISRDTLVWRTGMPDWVKASDLPELSDLFIVDVNATDTTSEETADRGWYAMLNGNRVGPTTVADLISKGLTPDTPVWHNGLHDWVVASTQAEIAQAFNDNRPPHYNTYGQQPNFSQNPQYGQHPFNGNQQSGTNQFGQNPNFAENPQYNNQQSFRQNNFGNNSYNRNPYNNSPIRTNWLPWAIAATIVGFLFSCIGSIFGIIGIVQANKANDMFAAGYNEQGDAANNTAKIMTIIGFILAGIGLITSFTFFKSTSMFNYI